MQSRYTRARSILLAAVMLAAVSFVTGAYGSRGTPIGPARLIAFESLPGMNDEVCTWEMARADASRLPGTPFYAQSPSGPAQGGEVSARRPLRFVQDPYSEFSAVTVDHGRNEVILVDAAHFNILVYDRTVTTPASAEMTVPKRKIGGLKTKSQYASDAYVDPKTGEIYAVNNDSLTGMNVFSRDSSRRRCPEAPS